jgi:hypothetical protein
MYDARASSMLCLVLSTLWSRFTGAKSACVTSICAARKAQIGLYIGNSVDFRHRI